MSKKDKYETHRYVGIPVGNDGNGGYQLKVDPAGQVKVHTWRTGKHTKGKFRQPGQLMLTENNMMVVILEELPLAFKNRHQVVPLQRFLTAKVDSTVLSQGMTILKQTE
ncbi:MAG TPA: hypothetical protein H9876_04025 [Candidatus Limosilactobacillus merdipullorum]|uniref:DUF7671 domain-containing protein n=1 Tax=Candidatus Limosilactobacillus merdipullorum TaxID=2838653 RepID=A0A9D1QPH9_9LACO|nr:hypothetical protein [Candidatus Limosilactobacillus merdipullorum]